MAVVRDTHLAFELKFDMGIPEAEPGEPRPIEALVKEHMKAHPEIRTLLIVPTSKPGRNFRYLINDDHNDAGEKADIPHGVLDEINDSFKERNVFAVIGRREADGDGIMVQVAEHPD